MSKAFYTPKAFKKLVEILRQNNFIEVGNTPKGSSKWTFTKNSTQYIISCVEDHDIISDSFCQVVYVTHSPLKGFSKSQVREDAAFISLNMNMFALSLKFNVVRLLSEKLPIRIGIKLPPITNVDNKMFGLHGN